MQHEVLILSKQTSTTHFLCYRMQRHLTPAFFSWEETHQDYGEDIWATVNKNNLHPKSCLMILKLENYPKRNSRLSSPPLLILFYAKKIYLGGKTLTASRYVSLKWAKMLKSDILYIQHLKELLNTNFL